MQKLLCHKLDVDGKDMRRILAITLPAMIELVFSQLFGMVDTMMLGHTDISAIALAAVGYTNNPMNLLLGVMSAFNVGTTAAVAWSLGAGDIPGARQVVRTALGLNFIMGAITTLLGTGLAGPLVAFMAGNNRDAFTLQALPYAKQYMQVCSAGLLVAALNMAVTGALRGAGQTRLPMVYNLASNLLNVVGNYVLIYGHLGFPAMGVLGAAISTTFSRAVGMVAALVVLFRVDSQIRLQVRDGFRMRIEQVKRILRVGTTTATEQAIMQIGFILFARSVAGLGATIFAAHQIGLNINGLSWVPAQGFGVAATTLVGQSMGAGEPKKARAYATVVLRMALIASAAVGLLFALGSHLIAQWYINDVAVAMLAAGVLRIMALGMPGIAIQQTIGATLRGAGDSMFPLVASILGIWVFRVLVAPLFIYTFGWGLTGAWLSIVLDQTTRASVVYARFAGGKWMHKRTLAA